MPPEQPDIGSNGARPLFIVGVPRSGTTFLHQLINAHPSVLLTDELRVVSWIFAESKKIREGFKLHGNPYPFNHGEEFSSYLVGNCGKIIAPFYSKLAIRSGKRDILYWGDKYPHYDEILTEMSAAFPRAIFVFIFRDLRDVTISVARGHNWSIVRAAEYVSEIFRRYVNKLSKIHSDRVRYIDYESLVLTPVEQTLRLLASLHLDAPASFDATIKSISTTQSHSARKPDTKRAAFDPSKAIGHWRDLSSSDRDQLDRILPNLDGLPEFTQLRQLAK